MGNEREEQRHGRNCRRALGFAPRPNRLVSGVLGVSRILISGVEISFRGLEFEQHIAGDIEDVDGERLFCRAGLDIDGQKTFRVIGTGDLLNRAVRVDLSYLHIERSGGRRAAVSRQVTEEKRQKQKPEQARALTRQDGKHQHELNPPVIPCL